MTIPEASLSGMLRGDFLGASPHPNPPPQAGEGLFRRSPTPSLACGGGWGWGLGREVRAAPIFLVSLHDRRVTSAPLSEGGHHATRRLDTGGRYRHRSCSAA